MDDRETVADRSQLSAVGASSPNKPAGVPGLLDRKPVIPKENSRDKEELAHRSTSRETGLRLGRIA